ncbi:uncharacterized protein [Panulirus ornatus]|uniref:uncharacterized protein n=1 Tax=Panulirus ornatus TaxID=150431 RepID=UPI003A891EF1
MDEVEDAHMCLRCRATIVGLKNYVTHKLTGCPASVAQKTTQNPEAPSTEEKNGETYEKLRQQQEDSSSATSSSSSQKTAGAQETTLQYPGDGDQTFPGRESKVTTLERPSGEALSHHEENLESAKYASSPSVTLRDCYVAQPTTSQNPPVTKADVRPLHDSYSVMEEFGTSVSQTHTEPQLSSGHSSPKPKTQESVTLSHRQTSSSQAPFTGYSDPLLPHGQESANITLFRHFDTFGDHSKIQHEGETETHSEAMALFKVASASYELESQNFESRYSDFYSLQHNPQEPLLTTVPTLEQCKAKQTTQTVNKISENLEYQNIKEREAGTEKRRNEEIRETSGEYRGDLKYSEGQMSPENQQTTQEKCELRQDDFLSSLELRSSVKVPAKRRHEDDEEEFDEDDDDETRPPHHHTGGKWRPGSRPPPSVGGKWRPATPKNEMEEDEEMEEEDAEEEEDSLMPPPPPTYTKGKWLPGKKITNIIKVGSSVEYHCHACRRTLKGKETYERHLNSELHFVNENKASGKKTTKISKEVPPLSVSSRPVRSKKLEAQSFLKSTIARLKSRKIFSADEKCEHKDDVLNKSPKKTARGGRLLYMKQEMKQEPNVDEEEEEVKKVSLATPKLLCPICKLSFGEAYAALHFASLAHIHNELEYKQNRCEEIDLSFNKILLQNFSAIVKTSPFLCNSCKFYCNLQEDFLAHMSTHVDDPEDDVVKTLFTCSTCNDEDEMRLPSVLRHLQTPHHLDNARDTILQARQVVLSCRTAVVCPLGDGTFRYLREYRTHRRVHHNDPGFQLSDQRLLRCPQCGFKALREKQIRAHIREAHENKTSKSDSYHCFVCGLAFSTHRQAELHRQSAEHRTTLGRQRGLPVRRTCSLCYVELEDLSALRRHMCQEHQKDSTPCHLCGIVPPLRFDLAKHQRVCRGQPGNLTGEQKCDLCTFRNDLLAHVLTHKTLAHGQRGPDGRHTCHICKTNLRSSSVKGHMLGHSNEWPHACHLCSRKFPKQAWLERHLSAVHTRGGDSQNIQGPSLCDTCGKTLSNRWHLYRHQLEAHAHASPSVPPDKDLLADSPQEPQETSNTTTSSSSSLIAFRSHRTKRTPPAPNPALCDVCGVQCDSPSMLKTHRLGHKRSEGDRYECPHCNYATSHLPHLRRHLRLHTGSTPFACPYCSYVCNNQENLRKHMLKTKRHPGRYMYECRLCDPPAEETPAGDYGITTSLNIGPATSQPLNLGSTTLRQQPFGSGTPLSQPLGPDAPVTQSLDPGSSQAMEYGVSKSLNIEESHSLGHGVQLSLGNKASSHTVETGSLQTSKCEIFKSNYATEFQAHLLKKHRAAFKTKEDVTSHIRSYYRPEEDSTVTTTPIPFVHKKRQRRACEPHGSKREDPDDLASEDTEEGEEDVLSQIKRTLDIGDYVTDNRGPNSPRGACRKAREVEEGQEEEEDDDEGGGGRHGEVLGGEEEEEEDERKERSSRNLPPVAGGRAVHGQEFGSSTGGRGSSRSYLRAGHSLLKPGHAQGGTPHPLRIVIQHIPESTTGDGGEDDGTRQVILILPEKMGEHPGDVAALLPSLGLASSSADCVSIAAVQPKPHHQHHLHQPGQQLQISPQDQHMVAGGSQVQTQIAKDPTDGAVIVQADQVISLDTQVVTNATILSEESGVAAQHHQNTVVLCPQPHQHHQVLHAAQVFNPLQVVAEAAEVLTQSEDIAHQGHEVLNQPSAPQEVLSQTVTQEVLGRPPIAQEVLGRPPIAQEVLGRPSISQEVLGRPTITQEVLTQTPVTQDVPGQTPVTEEVLTQAPVTHEVLGQPHITQEVLNQPATVTQELLPQHPVSQEVLNQTPVGREVVTPQGRVTQAILTQSSVPHDSQMLQTKAFKTSRRVQHAGTSQEPEAASILQQEEPLDFVDEEVDPSGAHMKRQGDEEGAGEIIYSLTLQ